MPRQARLDIPGTLHHIILPGIEKRQIYDDDLDRQSFVTRMAQLAFGPQLSRGAVAHGNPLDISHRKMYTYVQI